MSDEIKELLKELPTEEYKPLPFWSWNGELEPEKLRKQIRRMKSQGIGGFFMHARGGLKTEYMSDKWMECIHASADEAEKLGMQAWAYDENGWPSGFAGGKLLDDPNDRDKYILHSQGKFDPGATVSYRIDGERLVRAAGGEGEFLNLFIKTAVSTADILNPDVVRRFIGLTHEKYKESFGDSFNKRICGFFTDEPQYQRWQTPYTDMVEKYFRDSFGEDILDSLGLLFVEKEGYRVFRYRYWKAMQELMLHNFSEQIYNWCDDNGVKLTGHYVEEQSIGLQLMCCGGIMPFYEYEHIPGIDWLERGADNEIAPRQVASAAAQLGKKQVLSEMFACCGWNVSPDELGRIAGFQYVNGINLMCHHLVPYTELGQRKRDYPAHYSDVNPWVRESFGDFNNSFTMLGALLGECTESVNVAVLHPLRGAYFDYKREEEQSGFGIDSLDRQLRSDCRLLSGANITYHFLDETLLAKHGFVKAKKIGCGKCSYSFLVLPHTQTMDRTTEQLLKQYVSEGGKILMLGEKPSFLEGEKYEYSYLSSSCTLEDIITAQAFTVENRNTEIYSTLRELHGKRFIFAQNASETEAFTQSFKIAGASSFVRINPVTCAEEKLPLKVTLAAGESALLLVSDENVALPSEKKKYTLRFNNAEVSFKENYLTLDNVRYSFDGKDYSERISCMALFQKLLSDRYCGKLYLRYEFDLRDVPGHLVIRAEGCSAGNACVNGNPVVFRQAENEWSELLEADINELCHAGINCYDTQTDWFENDSIYYALFGENVSESLKNCIAYDSELEAVYLAGDFGVYSEKPFEKTPDGLARAERFYISSAPGHISEPVTDGLPFFSGTLTLKQEIDLKDCTCLELDGCFQTANVRINGKNAGKLLFGREIDVTDYAHEPVCIVEADLVLGNRNLLGPHHYVYDCRRCVSPQTFELSGTWKDGKSPYYRDSYEFEMLYKI